MRLTAVCLVSCVAISSQAQVALRIPRDAFQGSLSAMPVPVVYSGDSGRPSNDEFVATGSVDEMSRLIANAVRCRTAVSSASHAVFAYEDAGVEQIMAMTVPSTSPLVMVSAARLMSDRLTELNSIQSKVQFRFHPSGVFPKHSRILVSSDCSETSVSGLIDEVLTQCPSFRCRVFVSRIKDLDDFMRKQLAVGNSKHELLVDVAFMLFGYPAGVDERSSLAYRVAPFVSENEIAALRGDPTSRVVGLLISDSEEARRLGRYYAKFSDDRSSLAGQYAVLPQGAKAIQRMRIYNAHREVVASRLNDTRGDITATAIETSDSLSVSDRIETAVTLSLANSPIAIGYIRGLLSELGSPNAEQRRGLAEACVILAQDRKANDEERLFSRFYATSVPSHEISDRVAALQTMPVVRNSRSACPSCSEKDPSWAYVANE